MAYGVGGSRTGVAGRFPRRQLAGEEENKGCSAAGLRGARGEPPARSVGSREWLGGAQIAVRSQTAARKTSGGGLPNFPVGWRWRMKWRSYL